MNNDFSNVKIGDRLWSPTFGWMSITAVDTAGIVLKTSHGEDKLFNRKGNLYNTEYPRSLFFEEMQLVPLPKPQDVKTFDPNKPVCTKKGLMARFLGRLSHKEYPLVFAIMKPDGFECVNLFSEDGKYNINAESNFQDLINIPEKGWINIYAESTSTIASRLCKTRQEANGINCLTSLKRLACIQVSFKEGEGLNERSS